MDEIKQGYDRVVHMARRALPVLFGESRIDFLADPPVLSSQLNKLPFLGLSLNETQRRMLDGKRNGKHASEEFLTVSTSEELADTLDNYFRDGITKGLMPISLLHRDKVAMPEQSDEVRITMVSSAIASIAHFRTNLRNYALIYGVTAEEKTKAMADLPEGIAEHFENAPMPETMPQLLALVEKAILPVLEENLSSFAAYLKIDSPTLETMKEERRAKLSMAELHEGHDFLLPIDPVAWEAAQNEKPIPGNTVEHPAPESCEGRMSGRRLDY